MQPPFVLNLQNRPSYVYTSRYRKTDRCCVHLYRVGASPRKHRQGVQRIWPEWAYPVRSGRCQDLPGHRACAQHLVPGAGGGARPGDGVFDALCAVFPFQGGEPVAQASAVVGLVAVVYLCGGGCGGVDWMSWPIWAYPCSF